MATAITMEEDAWRLRCRWATVPAHEQVVRAEMDTRTNA